MKVSVSGLCMRACVRVSCKRGGGGGGVFSSHPQLLQGHALCVFHHESSKDVCRGAGLACFQEVVTIWFVWRVCVGGGEHVIILPAIAAGTCALHLPP